MTLLNSTLRTIMYQHCLLHPICCFMKTRDVLKLRSRLWGNYQTSTIHPFSLILKYAADSLSQSSWLYLAYVLQHLHNRSPLERCRYYGQLSKGRDCNLELTLCLFGGRLAIPCKHHPAGPPSSCPRIRRGLGFCSPLAQLESGQGLSAAAVGNVLGNSSGVVHCGCAVRARRLEVVGQVL
jgi:hypothetical protein